jgi:xanthine dehydrogenase accessory factor
VRECIRKPPIGGWEVSLFFAQDGAACRAVTLQQNTTIRFKKILKPNHPDCFYTRNKAACTHFRGGEQMLDLLKGLEECWSSGRPAVLATIIDTQGSTYRGVGAQCLILEDGRIIGTVSGGCVEGDIYEHAREVMQSGVPRTLQYDFRGSGDLLWGLGVGCNGSLTIWLAPFHPATYPAQAKQLLQVMRLHAASPRSFSIVTVIQSSDAAALPPGTLVALGHDREEGGALHGWGEIAERAAQYRAAGRSGLAWIDLSGSGGETIRVQCFIHTVRRVPRLVIFGAGPDAIPLVRGAKLLQWHVTVVDHRPAFAATDRFLDADEIIVAPMGTVPPLDVDEETNVVIMTHHFEQDQLFLAEMLTRTIAYLGILGPRARTEKLLEKIESNRKAIGLHPLKMKAFHSPVGLDIGAETPEEIAFSILSEMICARTRRSGMPLRLRKGPIHERTSSMPLKESV